MSDEGPTAPLSGPLVIDASCVVEYLVDLTHTDAATRLFHLAARGTAELRAPDLVYAECVSALRTLVRLGGVTEAFAVQAGDSVRVTVQGVGSAGVRFV